MYIQFPSRKLAFDSYDPHWETGFVITLFTNREKDDPLKFNIEFQSFFETLLRRNKLIKDGFRQRRAYDNYLYYRISKEQEVMIRFFAKNQSNIPSQIAIDCISNKRKRIALFLMYDLEHNESISRL